MDQPTNEAVTQRQKHPVLKIIKDTTEYQKYITSILNKLSDDNIDFVYNDLIKNITDIDGLNILVSNIMTKIGNEKYFVQTYAKLCCKLANINIKGVFLTHLISTKCKEIFDNYLSNKEIDKEQNLNYIKFIGYLYNLNFLKISAINYCLNKLFQNISSLNYVIEILINFLKIIIPTYKEMDNENTKKYLEKLVIIQNECLSFRDKFIIQDFLEKNKL
jgi:hypothetical protein